MTPKGYEHLWMCLKEGLGGRDPTPLLLAEHDYKDVMLWTTQEFVPLIFETPGNNIEANCR